MLEHFCELCRVQFGTIRGIKTHITRSQLHKLIRDYDKKNSKIASS